MKVRPSHVATATIEELLCGPLFTGVPWVSMATAYIAVIGINAAIRARGITGQGQRVSASLLDGVLATTIAGWMQVERPDTANFETWVIDPRAPKGFLLTAPPCVISSR